MEIICISCWRAFEHDTSTAAAQVTCPHCGFSQPGPDPSSLNAKLDANTRPSEVVNDPPPAATKAEESAENTSPELTPPAPSPEPKSAPEPAPAKAAPRTVPRTADFEAVTNPEPAPSIDPPAPEEAKADEPPKPDHRWRLRTPAKLVLYFSTYDALAHYLTGDEGAGYAVACGPGPFRTLTGFTSAMRVTDDPLEALVNVPPAEEGAEEAPAAPANPARPSTTKPLTVPPPPKRPQSQPNAMKPPSGEPEAPAQTRPRTRRRRTSATADFTFRKAQAQNPWPGRILFMLLGMAAGGAVVYYVAWIGLLPGIVY